MSRDAVGIGTVSGQALEDTALDVGRVIVDTVKESLADIGAGDQANDYVIVAVPAGKTASYAEAIRKALRVEVKR